ncbi:MAG: GntR family transcriptional regulator [Xanthomonadaceae bacterium]|nr:GntR family transcriptional regulator [Xanthomonadaceae bacterium]MDE1957501.1 GntR family transcriptional regulator [Xanthomonadaceae bacterium]MDE2177360.1 GntR family transcriptional regulator [Xanthomonadaceae bacterium]MDE2246889.1 GntR family transcriptional regulator [Xanthomonadaceae bacterium]
MDASLLTIAPGVAEPIYRQIVEQLRRMITSGQLPPGESLPSVRDVAGRHAINPMTVSRAYSLLEGEGLLERLRGMGMVVAATRRARPAGERMGLLEPRLHDLARAARELELPAGRVLRRLGELLEDGE